MPDVDIDFFDRDGVLKLFKHTPASIIKDNKIEKHKTDNMTLNNNFILQYNAKQRLGQA